MCLQKSTYSMHLAPCIMDTDTVPSTSREHRWQFIGLTWAQKTTSIDCQTNRVICRYGRRQAEQ